VDGWKIIKSQHLCFILAQTFHCAWVFVTKAIYGTVKGFISIILSMVFKLAQSAENRWNKLRGFKLLADVIEGVKFVDGEKQEVETLDSEDRMSA
jgi:hypothetical protein